MIILRCANALPPLSVSGRAMAAASEMTPRIPVQPNSSRISFCRPSKKGSLSTSRMIASARWPA
jgi:hypothetical protein